jgi:FtsP/CotA-like multicopper oxidase with cupredoxin domain
MREIRTSGLMSGEGKRGVAARPKQPRPSSTLLCLFVGYRRPGSVMHCHMMNHEELGMMQLVEVYQE